MSSLPRMTPFDRRVREVRGTLRAPAPVPRAVLGNLESNELVNDEKRLTTSISRCLEGGESKMYNAHTVQQRTEPYRLLDVKVLRCAFDRNRFRWSVRERDGRIVETALSSFATEAEAFRAGNAAARAIRKRG